MEVDAVARGPGGGEAADDSFAGRSREETPLDEDVDVSDSGSEDSGAWSDSDVVSAVAAAADGATDACERAVDDADVGYDEDEDAVGASEGDEGASDGEDADPACAAPRRAARASEASRTQEAGRASTGWWSAPFEVAFVLDPNSRVAGGRAILSVGDTGPPAHRPAA